MTTPAQPPTRPGPYRTVVVGTDGSTTANEAVCRAAVIASRLDVQLLVATVFARPSPHELGPPSERAEMPTDLWMSAGYRAAADVAADAVQRAQGVAANLDTDWATVEGDPAERLIGLAEDRPESLLVVGGQGMTSSKRFVLGNVPNKISHHATGDVLIVRTGQGGHGTTLPQRFLVGVDRSDRALRAVQRAAELTAAVGGELKILTVDDDPEIARETLNRAASYAAEAGVDSARGMHTEGDPAEELCQAADDVDVVVVGNRGMTGAARFLLGSVPNKVSHHVGRDLLIVRTNA